jgi:intracellular septation protein
MATGCPTRSDHSAVVAKETALGDFGYTLRYFAGDLVPMIVFLGIFLATRNVVFALGVGIAVSVAQLIYALVRRSQIGVLQWASLGLLVVFGGATLVTQDARFIMFKPTVIHVMVGAVMLRPGWMERYVPANERERIRPMLTAFGFIWAGLMFVTAAANAVLVVFADPVVWAKFNLLFPPISMVGLFVVQNVYIRARVAAVGYRVP